MAALKKIGCNIKAEEIRQFGDKWLLFFTVCKIMGFLATDQNMT